MKKLVLNLAAFTARILPAGVKQALYRTGPLARMLRRALNRAAPAGFNIVRVAGGDLEGYSLRLDLQTEKDYWLGTYESDLQSVLRDLVRPGMVAYDVGANIGYVSLLLAHASAPDGTIHAFEALPDNVNRLRENVALNKLTSRISIHPCAVTGDSQPVRFLVHASGGMGKMAGSAGREETYRAEISVPGVSLDDFVYQQGNPAPDVVKMDIEGGEVLALPGMKRLLVEARPLVLLELHGPEAARAAWDTLTGCGYRLFHLKSGLPDVKALDDLDWKAYLVARPPE